MSHVPYGYRIENGKAVIDEEKAKQVKKIYKAYLSGLAYVPAAEAAGLKLYHTGAKKMMQNKHYLGDDYYPAIIDNETFVAAEAERVKRQAKLGRVFDDNKKCWIMIRKKLSQHCSTYKKAVRTKNSFPIFSPYGFFYMCLISLSYSESDCYFARISFVCLILITN